MWLHDYSSSPVNKYKDAAIALVSAYPNPRDRMANTEGYVSCYFSEIIVRDLCLCASIVVV
jgi:hypothetical protein